MSSYGLERDGVSKRRAKVKIDIHAHTKATKSGDSPKRNINAEKFAEIIEQTNVAILAITNHNHFDIEQYREFTIATEGKCQIWPGVEIDVHSDDGCGHLLVIVNPKKADLLSDTMQRLLTGTTEDKLILTIDEVAQSFKQLDAIYVAHYHSKTPDLSDDALIKLGKLVDERRIIKEATNPISAGIYISHGHNTIYGSDVVDWDNYVDKAELLPELRLNVESFEQFCLLLEKDEPTIKTLLHKKDPQTLTIKPFETDEKITLDIYDDINIIFGSKGTGKTKILEAISAYYNEQGMQTSVLRSTEEKLEETFDLKGRDIELNIENYGIDACYDEISRIKKATDVEISSLSNYRRHFEFELTNRIAKTLVVKDFEPENVETKVRGLNEANRVQAKFLDFVEFIKKTNFLKNELSNDLYEELIDVLNRVSEEILRKRQMKFKKIKSAKLFNNFVRKIAEEVQKKAGQPVKPQETGFQQYASNRLKIEKAVNKIMDNMQKDIAKETKFVGTLGEKGNLRCITDFRIQDGNLKKSEFSTYDASHKTPKINFAKKISEIQRTLYTNDLFATINELNAMDGIDGVKSIYNLILFYRYFSLNGVTYTPSSGEASMLLLQRELDEDKDIYILDEPEKSLGNDYINDVIVPILKERAKVGKRLIIATHDANIAIRTLPYNSVFRKHEINCYSTYVGNPFSDSLINIEDQNDILNWKDISMKILEGGREAFGERGKIYGKV